MKIDAQKIAVDAVTAIFEDLRDRHTLKHLFDPSDGALGKIDDEIQQEIFNRWKTIIVAELRKAGMKK